MNLERAPVTRRTGYPPASPIAKDGWARFGLFDLDADKHLEPEVIPADLQVAGA